MNTKLQQLKNCFVIDYSGLAMSEAPRAGPNWKIRSERWRKT